MDVASSESDISVVVPVVERFDDPAILWREYGGELRRLGRSFEFVFVVDGSQHSILPALRALKRHAQKEVRVLVFGRTFGEAAALAVGIERSRGAVVLTLPSYLQVAPEGIDRMLRALEGGGTDVVVGRRYPRTDACLNRVQSWVFHRIMGWMTGTRFNDVSCGLRVLRRETARELVLYGDLHRFLPILAASQGFTVLEIAMAQRAEDRGVRYAGLGVYMRRLLDVLSVFFLTKFTRKPLRFFGLIGAGSMAVGGGITVYLGIYRLLGAGGIADRPLLLLGVLLLVLGVQSISIGLLGEIIIFTHARRLSEYRIAEILE